MQREISTVADLIQVAEDCACEGTLEVLGAGRWSESEARAMTQCGTCGDGWLVAVFKVRAPTDIGLREKKKAEKARAGAARS